MTIDPDASLPDAQSADDKPRHRLVLRFQNQIFEALLDQCPIHLGRGNRNQIILPDTEIAASRQHAVISNKNGQFVISDTSSNGTFVTTDATQTMLNRESIQLLGSGILGLGKEVTFLDPLAIHFAVRSGHGSSLLVRGGDLQGMEDGNLERTPLRLLLDSSLSDEMTLNEVKILSEVIVIKKLFSFEPLITEHEMDPNLYCIISGSLSVSAQTENTVGKASLHILETGDLAGEFGFVDDVQRTATLRSVGETEVICLSRSRFNEVVSRHPMIGYKLMRTLIRSIRMLLLRMNVQYMDLETAFRRQLRKNRGGDAGEMTLVKL